MKIDNIKWLHQESRPILGFDLDGKPARVFYEQKQTLVDAGILVLLPNAWTGQLPPVTLPADPEDGRPTPIQVHNAVKSPELMREFLAMVKAPQREFLARATELPEGI